MKYTFVKDGAEQEIINNLQSSLINRRKAEEKLFLRYSFLIRSGTKKYCIEEDEAFNAYSDTVLAIINAIHDGSFKGDCSLNTYLYGIFHNKCIDIVRRNTAQKNVLGKTIPIGAAEMHLCDMAKPAIETLIKKSEYNILVLKLNKLGNTSRRVMLLHAEGYVDKEIAVMLQYKTPDVVKTTRLRCLKKLSYLVC